MDILNFISWIRGKRQVTSVDPTRSVLPVGLKDPKRDDDYIAGAITVQDFTAQVASVIPSGAQGPQGPQGVPGPVGPAGLNWQGAWSASGTYVVDDAVGYGGASWFCINAVGPSAATPDTDPTNWALLASQGATGPQGPQGIQGPQGPSGSGTPGTIVGQTMFWNGTAWAPTSAVRTNGIANSAARLSIGNVAPSFYSLDILSNGGGIKIQQNNSGWGIGNYWQTGATAFQYGINPPNPANPVSDNSVYYTHNGPYAIKFATNFSGGGGDRLIIQGNGQVTVGNLEALNTEAKLVVKGGSFEVEDAAAGIILSSPNGTRWRITINDSGTVVRTAI